MGLRSQGDVGWGRDWGCRAADMGCLSQGWGCRVTQVPYGAAAGLSDDTGQQLRLGPSRLHVLAVLLPDLWVRTGINPSPRISHPSTPRHPCPPAHPTLLRISNTSCGSV